MEFKDSLRFDLRIEFEESRNYVIAILSMIPSKQKMQFFEANSFTKEYKLGEKIDLPFFSGTIR